MNGYYQIFNNNGKCCLKIFPPTDGGEPILREELTEYLSYKNFSFDVKQLYKTLDSMGSEPAMFPFNMAFSHADGEYVRMEISPDNMSVTVRIIPCFAGGVKMSKDEFMREFTARGITHGYDEEAIDDFLNRRPYCTDAILCKGTPALQGRDANIEYFFNTDPRVRPTQNEDGSVDFFNLNTINHCKEGDLLARLTPGVPGKNGMNVKGELIRPREVKQYVLKYGHNISINDDKTEIFSDVNGHVNLVEGKVFVSNVFEVENVDNSIGNIEYDGNVCVNGNVRENFSIKAHGNIEVKGVVEGASLEADGDIIIARGMNGMHKGVLKAKGNVVAKFLENATVNAEGYVEADSIMHSNVISGLDIKVNGRKGFISGGRTCATNSVEVKNLGSAMGADTVVEVGMDTKIKQEMNDLQKSIVEIDKQLQVIKPVLEGAKAKLAQGIKMSTEQLTQIQSVAKMFKDLSAKRESAVNELSNHQSEQDDQGVIKGQVIVTGEVYSGTKICIGDVSMVVKSTMKYCRFVKEGGDVKMVGIN